jgi:hypothetical protein
MTLGNVRELGAHHLIAFCLNDGCHHQALIDVSSYAMTSKKNSPEQVLRGRLVWGRPSTPAIKVKIANLNIYRTIRMLPISGTFL